ncbi:IPT/TIG domain-containing protein [Geothrix terrae]|uniref:IPT/TIG domain-containing protein n=1 Tax=Geothrix terrae TaxID=2922720 RepID=UPI001FAD70FF|nr:IPT/TIG domain-containing protein [Geothrix terrae]
MPLDPAQVEAWDRARREQPLANIHPLPLAGPGGSATRVDWLEDVSTRGPSRDQGANGNCWNWAASAMSETALKVAYGYADRLSVQYVDSLADAYTFQNGGDLATYCKLVNGPGLLVPESNANAAYVDGIVDPRCTQSLVPTSAIQLSPAYTHVAVSGKTVQTSGVSQATAIANIKNMLDQHKVVGFSFITQFSGAGGFEEWWETQAEDVLWPEPVTGPTGPPDERWGAHMVVIVGYDESDPTPANHFWIVLNSWGLTPGRPGGLFRMPMAMNYGATFTYAGKAYTNYGFEVLDLSADHPAATVPDVAMASSSQAKLGQPLTFSATPTGYPPFTYQWQVDGQDIPDARSAAYTLPYLTGVESGRAYRVVVSNTVGGLPVQTSGPAVVVPSMAGQQQLLGNPGFEGGLGQAAWTTATTQLGTPIDFTPWRQESSARTGQWDAFLGGPGQWDFNGALDQTLTIPSGPGSVLLSYWLNGRSGLGLWGTGFFSLSVSILDAATGQLLRPVMTYGSSSFSAKHLLWKQDRFGLGDLKGRQVKIHCDWMVNSSFWRLDDFAVVLDPSDPVPLPVISSFTPASGNPGDPVILTGSGFTGATHVAFNGLDAPFSVQSDTQIATTVPKASVLGSDQVTTGPILVNTPGGSGLSSTSFQVLRPLLMSISPRSCKRGTSVVLTGSGLTGCTSVAFQGMAGFAAVPAPFTVDSDTQITATVPPMAISGSIQVTTPFGSASYYFLIIEPDGAVSVAISPRPLAVVAGSTVTFTATVTGDVDQRVGWLVSNGGGRWSLSGNPLTFTIEPAMVGDLSLRVDWGNSGTVSDTLAIPVKTLDFLGTGTVDVLDMLELAKAYGSRTGDATFDPKVDLNGDGVIDDTDVSLFMDVFPRIQP